jgi:hypothetical protein
VELEKAGMGTRKRARIIGGKENISDAPWKKGMLGDEEFGCGMPSPKKQRLSMAPGDVDAFVVPRKRTNANHLITPRKPLRKTPLVDQAQATIAAQNILRTPVDVPPNAQETIQQASTSPAKLALQKIPLNDLAEEEAAAAAPTEKPVRRRKSLRRSTRRLTRGTTPEQHPAAPAEDILVNHDPALHVLGATGPPTNNALETAPPLVEAPQTVSEPLSGSIKLEGTGISTEALEQSHALANVQEPVSLNATEDLLSGLQQEVDLPVEGLPATSEALEEDLKESCPVYQPDRIPTETSGTSHKQLQNNQVKPVIAIEEERPARANQTPKPQHLVLNSIELGTETRFASPTRNTGTPRSRRKTPQRRGSRRSTRSTRANSVPPEDQSAQQGTIAESITSQISCPASSPIKSTITEMPTVQANKSTYYNIANTDNNMSANTEEMDDTENVDLAVKQIDVEVHRPETESTERDGIMTSESSRSTKHSEEGDLVEPVVKHISSIAEADGEHQCLSNTPILKNESSSEGCISKVEENVNFDVDATTAVAQTDDEHVSSPSKTLQSEEAARLGVDPSSDEPREASVEALEVFEPISISLSTENLEDTVDEPTEELHETSTPNPSTTKLVETISESAPAITFDHDDTDMLRNFLTRVKANKAAKASTSIPKRKRSLPHSPIRLPLESVDSALSPSSPKSKDEFDVGLPGDYPKRKRNEAELGDDDATEPKSIRRSGRTRLPVKAAPLAAPSFIPVRRLGQDGDNTVTLRRNEEKELAALTRVNTRKNKGGAQLPVQVLAKQADEKEDPASRQRALKEVFDEKAQRQKKGKKRKTVVWAEELAQFQTEEGKTVEFEREPEKEKEKEKALPIEEKKTAVKVGVRSKMTLGMVVNGTPAPKRKMRGCS